MAKHLFTGKRSVNAYTSNAGVPKTNDAVTTAHRHPKKFQNHLRFKKISLQADSTSS
jgi:hypothetical protein